MNPTATPKVGFAEIEIPWYLRVPVATAVGALLGIIADFFALSASKAALLLALSPAVAALNTMMSDLGRRKFSIGATFGSALVVLAALGLIGRAEGAAVATIVVGGLVATRLVAPGRHIGTRRSVLFVLGALYCPMATIAAYHAVKHLAPDKPISVHLAIFHALFWLPLAASEAALAWSAARSRLPRPLRSRGNP